MSENRRQVLEMLATGKITSEEAERLIAALEKEPQTSSSSGDSEPRSKTRPKFMRVIVEDDKKDTNGKSMKVNVRIPLQLLRAGVKLASIIPSSAQGKVQIAMGKHAIDLGQFKPENVDELIDHLSEMTIDMDEKSGKEKVRVYCE